MSNLRQHILAKNDRRTELMPIPEWGVSIEVRGMSAKLRDRYLATVVEAGLDKEEDQSKVALAMLPLMPEFVLEGVYDPETGEKVFLSGDLDALRDKNGDVIQRIAQKVIDLSALDDKAADEAGKPSSVTPNDASTSA